MGLSKPIRFRKAVLGLTAIETDARELKVEDVVARWSFLSQSGFAPFDIVKIGNGADIEDATFLKLMNSLNSRL
jgi:hypothetical protein